MNKQIELILLFIFFSTAAHTQPYRNAHAHNDYEHDRPLFEAMQNGFASVEADIYLVRGRLLVSHLWPLFTSNKLEDLYLAPLDSLVRLHHGKVYPHYSGTFYLMIDIKSDGQAVYPVLLKLVDRYPALFQTTNETRAVTIFLSGNRPIETVAKDPFRRMLLDGRPSDLGKGFPSSLMPVISDNYTKWSDWNGKDVPDRSDLKGIKELAGKVHAEGKLLRLWEIPDRPEAWKALLDAGVDFINSDKLGELSVFLKALK